MHGLIQQLQEKEFDVGHKRHLLDPNQVKTVTEPVSLDERYDIAESSKDCQTISDFTDKHDNDPAVKVGFSFSDRC